MFVVVNKNACYSGILQVDYQQKWNHKINFGSRCREVLLFSSVV